MFGTPWVRFALRCLRSSNGASASVTSSCGDFGGRLVLHRGQDQRDDALGDRGIAVGEEVKPAFVAVG